MRKAKLTLLPFIVSAFFLVSCGRVTTSAPITPSTTEPTSQTSEETIRSISIEQKDQTLLYNEELQLTVKDDKGKEIPSSLLSFSSTNSSTATVSESGLIKALDVNASCYITVSLKANENIEDKIQISVQKRVLVSSIEASSLDIYLSKDGGYMNFSYQVFPANATDKRVDVFVEDPSIATLNTEKNQIIALKSGNTTLVIKAKETFSKVEKRIPVTVNKEGYVSLAIDEALSPTKYFTYNDMLTLNNEGGLSSTAPKDNPEKVLVLPIEFSDYPFRSTIKEDLNTLFNSSGETDTHYWESVTSYYEKSSFGKLNFSFTIADSYKVGKKALQAIPDADEHEDINYTDNLVEEALAYYKKTNPSIDLKDYDRNKDGTIDAIWAIYSAPDHSQKDVELNSKFWAFVSSNEKEGNINDPIVNRYGWASYDFMDHAGEGKIDAHTYIHETGHLLGLDDYYNYAQILSTSSPLGEFDMMDSNVGDHNAWSKIAMGWETPYIYDYSKEKTAKVHLKPNDQGTSLLITPKYNNTAFDEFLMLELYSPKGLNRLDSSVAYDSQTPQMLSTYGIKMYHVDARLVTQTTNEAGTVAQKYYDTSTLSNKKITEKVQVGASNTPLYPKNLTKEKYALITLISANKSGGTYLNTRAPYTASDLFTANTTFDTGFTFNNGTKLNLRITFEKVDPTGADIRIEPLH